MPSPKQDYNALADLRGRVRAAMHGRHWRAAFEALKQILASEPGDRDAQHNLDQVLLIVARHLEDFEKKHGSLQDVADEDHRQSLLAQQDKEQPIRRGN